jgi:Asp-tRNA(Asn)/Glu-tRNA(Gln) amidotransferase C subunit
MKPLPAETPKPTIRKDPGISELPVTSAVPSLSLSNDPQQAGSCTLYRSYPWMLLASTAVAGIFCLLYITKPVVQASQSNHSQPTSQPPLSITDKPPTSLPSHSEKNSAEPKAMENLMPSPDHLPGETAASSTNNLTSQQPTPQQPATSPAHEETNLRVQHIINAEGPDGLLAKIHLNVPVLYQSRNLRWTPEEVGKARELLNRLADYQEKTQNLRAEGTALLESWNHLVEHSIPSNELRADSPTIPLNQQDASAMPRPAGLNSDNLIRRIQPINK